MVHTWHNSEKYYMGKKQGKEMEGPVGSTLL